MLSTARSLTILAIIVEPPVPLQEALPGVQMDNKPILAAAASLEGALCVRA